MNSLVFTIYSFFVSLFVKLSGFLQQYWLGLLYQMLPKAPFPAGKYGGFFVNNAHVVSALIL